MNIALEAIPGPFPEPSFLIPENEHDPINIAFYLKPGEQALKDLMPRMADAQRRINDPFFPDDIQFIILEILCLCQETNASLSELFCGRL